MKKGQIYEGIIEKVDFPNKAVITTVEKQEDGSTTEVKTVVKGGIPGQKVSFVVNKARRDKCKGRIKEVIEPSSWETATPACPKFGTCGGCNYQTLPYETQLELKKNQVLSLIDDVYRPVLPTEKEDKADVCEKKRQNDDILVSPETEGKKYQYDGILASPEIYGYRNKMEFSFGDEVKDGPLTLGLHKKGSFHDIVDADCCKIVHNDFTKVLCCVRDYCRELNIPHYKKNTHTGVLRHLLVRRASATGELLVALVVSSQQEYDWQPLAERLQTLQLEGTIVGFLLITNDGLGDVVKSDKTTVIFGKDYFIEEILGLQFKISPFSFFQTNTKGAEVLYQRARDYILEDFDGNVAGQPEEKMAQAGNEKQSTLQDNVVFDAEQDGNTKQGALQDKVVFDLYSGTGTIAQIIAPIAKKVIGVEIVEEAVEAAKENAARNGLTNCEFIAGDVLKVLDEISEKPDFIILDPPRDGIHPKALRKIIDYGVKNIVYISCKPTSLARDLEVFQEHGYELERMSNVDLFPETVHVECVTLLQRKDI
ncbi:MAG: class I SAM-dependent RNA methyltransferase [Butyribacter sp.]|nr:class I SAM-dependent RNA methyltransferase [bacterium]MDY3853589.1 class I SAM-dependent RNA methyltransferase [Butyribacter sp.]